MTSPLPDIRTDDDIRQLVDGFYQRVQTDDLLGPVFGAVVRDQWPRHLATMYDFWSGLLLGTAATGAGHFPSTWPSPLMAATSAAGSRCSWKTPGPTSTVPWPMRPFTGPAPLRPCLSTV